MRITARAVVLETLLAHPGREEAIVEVPLLLRMGSVFDLSGGAIRVALGRMRDEGWIVQQDRGRYGLGRRGQALFREVARWRDVKAPMRAWKGDWIGVAFGDVPRAGGRARPIERAFALMGLRTFSRGFAVRPDNLVGGAIGLRSRVNAQLEEPLFVFEVRELELSPERARELWEVASLEHAHEALTERLHRSAKRLDESEASVREAFLLGREAIRALVRDPLLPEPIFDGAHRDALLEAMIDYDRIGKALWTRFLEKEAS